MAITVTPYAVDLDAAVQEFNARLRAAGVTEEFQLSQAEATGLAKRRVFEECFLALEDRVVRGGFILNHRDFSFSGNREGVPHYRLPISEGIVNKAYASVGVQMLRSALRCYPMLYALGMGGWKQPLPRMLKAAGWSLFEVPFYFRVCKPYRFFRRLNALRRTARSGLLMDLAAWSGAGWLATRVGQGLKRRRAARRGRVQSEIVAEFTTWADAVWERSRQRYAMVAVRDSQTLNVLYPPGSARFLRLLVREGDTAIGWAVLLDTQMRDDKYFGDLRVGSIADCLADPDGAPQVIHEAASALAERGVDLIVSNQTHRAWSKALEQAGFFRGPSNFLFAASPKLSERLEPLAATKVEIHFNRGDGDGPVHL